VLLVLDDALFGIALQGRVNLRLTALVTLKLSIKTKK
jgi:hypothetical protein